MKAELRDLRGDVVATVTVGDDGAAVLPDGPLGENLRDTAVLRPGADGPVRVDPAAGEDYVHALPYALRTPYLRAVLVD